MPNLIVKIGTVDLSAYVRVNPDNRMDIAQADMVEPAWSDSPLFEGQVLTSLHVKNKELKIPLFLHPPDAPYTQDPLNRLIIAINNALRPVVDLGLTSYVQLQLAQAPSPTFFTLQFGRFEPDFNFRMTEKGWFAGTLHLWVAPYGHTATERSMGTWSAPPNQSGMQVPFGPGYRDTALALNPAMYLRFDETAGPTAADTSGNGNVASYLQGMVFGVPGALGGANPAVKFGAAGVVGPVGSQINPAKFTIAAWVNRATSALPTQMAIAANRDFTANGSNVGFFIGMLGTNSLVAALGCGSGAVQGAVNNLQLVPGQYSHVAVTFDGSNCWMFVNGQASIFSTFSTPSGYPYRPMPQSNLTIGYEGGNNYLLNGSLDEFTIFQSALSTSAIATLAAAGPLGVRGDAPPQFDVRLTTGSYIGDDGRLGVIAALSQQGYVPIDPTSRFIVLTPSAIMFGASGAWGSQMLALDSVGGSIGAQGGLPIVNANGPGFSFTLSPGSVYAGENRVLGLVRARYLPYGLRAFKGGVPLGPTVVASSMEGWQVVDYGVLRVAPWEAIPMVDIRSYAWLDPKASGIYAAERGWPAWTKEHGPVFVVPADSTILDLDWNSSLLAFDGFDGAAGATIGLDALGNTWTPLGVAAPIYTGNSAIAFASNVGAGHIFIASQLQGDSKIEAIFTHASYTNNTSAGAISLEASASGVGAAICKLVPPLGATPALFSASDSSTPTPILFPLTNMLPGRYELSLVVRNGRYVAGFLAAPSGCFSGSEKGQRLVASQAVTGLYGASGAQAGIVVTRPDSFLNLSVESFRTRSLASSGAQPGDILHLYQPLAQNTRANPSGVDLVDLSARQRGPVQAVTLSAPSLGAGIFAAVLPFDQGVANDILNVDIRVRERFTYLQ